MKVLVFITIIALFNCRELFGMDLAGMREQYERQLSLEQEIQDFHGKPTGQQVANALKGLTQAANYWSGFLSTLNKGKIQAKINELNGRNNQVKNYINANDGYVAVQTLSKSVTQLTSIVRTVRTIAMMLRDGAKRVQQLSDHALKSGHDTLTGDLKASYEKGVASLLSTLQNVNLQSSAAMTKCDYLQAQFNVVEGKLNKMSRDLSSYANGQGDKFRSWRDRTRGIVYGSAAACAAAGPFAIFTCPAVYATCAGILESKIKDERNRVRNVQNQFNGWSNSFKSLAGVASQSKANSKAWYIKITDFKNKIQSTDDLIRGSQEALYLSSALRDLIKNDLVKMQNAANTLLSKANMEMEMSIMQDLYAYKRVKQMMQNGELDEELLAYL